MTPKTRWFPFLHLLALCLNISAQNNYCCTGYGGLFADSLGVSAPEIREVATLPNAYGNTRVRLMIHRPVLQKPASCNLTKRPCLILVHGGFWAELGADNTWMAFSNEAARNFVSAGFVTASIRYRTGIGGGNELSLALGQPCLMNPSSDIAQAAGKAAYDVQLATQYIFEKADEWGIDTAQVYYFGSSAGAFNVINATYMAKGEQLLGTAMLARARVRGTIGLVGGVNDLSIFDAADPKVPLLLFHGTADEVVPFDCGMISHCPVGSSFQVPVCGSKAIYDRCQQLGVPVDMQIACGSNHGLTGLPLSYVICRAKQWLSERIAGKVAPNGITYATGLTTIYLAQPCASVTCQAPNGVCPPGTSPIHDLSQAPPLEAVVFPNPAQDRAMLRYNTPLGGIIRIALLDVLGRLVSEHRCMALEGDNIAEIDLWGVPNGPYWVRVCSDGAVLVLRGERYK